MSGREHRRWDRAYLRGVAAALAVLRRTNSIDAATARATLEAFQDANRGDWPVAPPVREPPPCPAGAGDTPLERWRRALPGLEPDTQEVFRQLVAGQDIPAAGIHAGDLLLQAWGLRSLFRRVARGRFSPVMPVAMLAVAEAVDTIGLVRSSWCETESEARLQLRRELQHSANKRLADQRRGLRLHVDTLPLWIMHPFRELERPESLEASSDDGAIFELLAQVGCTMPRPPRRRRRE